MNHEKQVVDRSTGEIENVNDNFIQFYRDNMDLIIEVNRKNPTAGTILMWIIRHMGRNNSLVVSQTALCEQLGVHRNTVTNAVRYLKEVKALTVYKTGTSNVYAINTEIAWRSTADNKQYAYFTSKVFLSAGEQTKVVSEPVNHVIKKRSNSRNRQKQLDAVAGVGGPIAMLCVSIASLIELLTAV
jgi:DNA-binding transcriptional regulator YhcF (GntR family)